MLSNTSFRRRNYDLTSHRKDEFISFIKGLLKHSFVLRVGHLDTMSDIEELVEQHMKNPERSSLRMIVSTIGTFFTKLPLRKAFIEYDAKYRITARKHIPPSFNDIRHILNLAQIKQIVPNVKLLTFDGDQTLYQDGKYFEDEKLISYFIKLIRHGKIIAVVTAASYGHNAEKYEGRLIGLLNAFSKYNLSKEELERFLILGGECNYLFKCTAGGPFGRN